LERAETIAAIRQGLAEFERSEEQPAREVLEALRAKHGISSCNLIVIDLVAALTPAAELSGEMDA
jgi:RecA/RadA recombinase